MPVAELAPSAAARLKVCVTCNRYAVRSGGIGQALARALEDAGSSLIAAGAILLRKVPCLSGCKHPGNVELGRLGGEKIRLSNVAPGHAPAIIDLARIYSENNDEENRELSLKLSVENFA